MKKIIIKEHAEFRNDIQRALDNIPTILAMDNAITVTPYHEGGVLTLEITAHVGASDAGSNVEMTIVCSTETTGGELERDQTYDSPAEYGDENVAIVSVDEVHYSEEFPQDPTGTQDINGIDVSSFIDNDLYEVIVNFANKYL